MLKDTKIAILGAGNMGRAIAKGLVQSGAVSVTHIQATELRPEAARAFTEATGVPCASGDIVSSAKIVSASDVLLLAVKPYSVGDLLEKLEQAGALAHRPLIISIAAGLGTAFLEKHSGGQCPVVRVMPNTPAAIGQGMTVACKGALAQDAHIELARAIFTPLGRFLSLEEKQMNAVTGLSGSGPAYVFLMIDALADGGVAQGLPKAVALELAAQTLLGSAALMLESGRHPAALKDDVTTPGGTTIAGLKALEDGALRSVLIRAVETAAQRSAELGR